MKFMLTRYPTDDGSGVFAAFAEPLPKQRFEMLLPGGDQFGELSPAILRAWAWAMLCQLWGATKADECADELAADELLAGDLREPVDWNECCLVVTQQEISRFLAARLRAKSDTQAV